MLRENRDEFLSSSSYSYSLLSSKLSWIERVKIPTVGLGIIRYELFHLNNQSSRSNFQHFKNRPVNRPTE